MSSKWYKRKDDELKRLNKTYEYSTSGPSFHTGQSEKFLSDNLQLGQPRDGKRPKGLHAQKEHMRKVGQSKEVVIEPST